MTQPTASSSPHEGSGNSEDWMKVLDRFLDTGAQDAGDLFHGGRESSDDLFLFSQLDGTLFHDSSTHVTQLRPRNRTSSVSLSSLLHNHHPETLDTAAFKTDDGTYHDNQHNTQVNTEDAHSDKKRAANEDADSASNDDLDAEEEEQDPEEEVKDQQARYERKRSLEKRRRLDTRSQFDALAATLRDIEQEFLVQDGSDPESDTCPNDSHDDPSTSNRPKTVTHKSSMNRVDLISRAVAALNRLQGCVRKLKKDKKALKRVVLKMNALSSEDKGAVRLAAVQQGSTNHHRIPGTQGPDPLNTTAAHSVMDMTVCCEDHFSFFYYPISYDYNFILFIHTNS